MIRDLTDALDTLTAHRGRDRGVLDTPMSQTEVAAVAFSPFPAEPSWVPPVLRSGYNAIAKFWHGFLLIEFCCIALVAVYFLWPPLQHFLDLIGQWKDRGGLLVVGLASALAGGVLPELVKAAVVPTRIPLKQRIADGTFNSAFFFFAGFLVVWLYSFQEYMFGNGNDWLTLTKKVLVDQFIWTPTLGVPLMPLAQAWRAANYRLGPTLRQLKPSFYWQRVMPVVLPNWCFWIPMCVAIYSLPSNLQYILFLLAMATWSMLASYMTRIAALQGVQPQAAPVVAAA